MLSVCLQFNPVQSGHRCAALGVKVQTLSCVRGQAEGRLHPLISMCEILMVLAYDIASYFHCTTK